MMLDQDQCYQALQTRDPRFDGRFFTCVVSTGIYCRPVCPARTPLLKNCVFVPSAAAAQKLGYRPCLRCRPECAPGAPAWRGTGAVVSRVLKLIADGALDEKGVDDLADRVGLGARHLRRLIKAHAGATPVELARTRRILFAKRLITETTLKMTDVAFASGFSSLRRFNDEMGQALRRAPRDLRKDPDAADPQPVLQLPLSYRPPYDWDGVLAFLRLRAVPGLETVTEATYTRRFVLGLASGQFEVSHVPARRALVARIEIDRIEELDRLVARIRAMFDLDADPGAVGGFFADDALIGPRLRTVPGLRIPQTFDPFEAGVRAIVGQQVSVKGAITILGRLLARVGPAAFSLPSSLAAADLSGIGMPGARIQALVAWARACQETGFMDRLRFDLDEAVAALDALPGIGPWTAHYLCLRGLAHVDAFPAGDLVLRQVAGLSERALQRRSEAWKPFRAYAAQALWRVPSLPAEPDRVPAEASHAAQPSTLEGALP